jgi:hypothetical protein
MFIIKLLSQHVSGIIMPIIRRTRVWTAAYGVLHRLWWLWLCGAGTRAVCTDCVPAPHNHSQHNQCRTPYAAVQALLLLMKGIMMPETCWDRSLIIKIRLVASCWFFSLHPTFMMHGHKSLKPVYTLTFHSCKIHIVFSSNLTCICSTQSPLLKFPD